MYSISKRSSAIAVAELRGSYQSQPKPYQWVEVLVDCPGCLDLFTYKIPEQLQIKAGDILSVPFGATQIGAIAIRLLTEPPADLAPEKISYTCARSAMKHTNWLGARSAIERRAVCTHHHDERRVRLGQKRERAIAVSLCGFDGVLLVLNFLQLVTRIRKRATDN